MGAKLRVAISKFNSLSPRTELKQTSLQHAYRLGVQPSLKLTGNQVYRQVLTSIPSSRHLMVNAQLPLIRTRFQLYDFSFLHAACQWILTISVQLVTLLKRTSARIPAPSTNTLSDVRVGVPRQ